MRFLPIAVVGTLALGCKKTNTDVPARPATLSGQAFTQTDGGTYVVFRCVRRKSIACDRWVHS